MAAPTELRPRRSAAEECTDSRRSKCRPGAAEEVRAGRGRIGRPRTVAESKDCRGEDSADRRPRTNEKVRLSSINSYKRLRKIGEGAYGAVTKARHIDSGEIVAIKSGLHADGDAALLLREASMLAVCAGSPAVVRLREVARGSDMHEFYLVMEFVGPSLADVIRSLRRCRCEHPFSESEVRDAMAQLLAGASTMHARGIIHCDLKPSNVLVGEKDGRLKICDFGLAKSVVAPPTDTDLEGTPGYMAPEVLMSQKDCGTPVDIWSLGCIMSEMLSGKPLFPEEDVFQQLISIVDLLGIPDDVSMMPLGVSPPSKLRERVSEDLLSPVGFDVLEGLLEYNPKDRLTADAALSMAWFAAKDN